MEKSKHLSDSVRAECLISRKVGWLRKIPILTFEMLSFWYSGFFENFGGFAFHQRILARSKGFHFCVGFFGGALDELLKEVRLHEAAILHPRKLT